MRREPLSTQKAKLRVQLQKKQDQVKEAYDKLKRSSVFSAKMFLEVFAVNLLYIVVVHLGYSPSASRLSVMCDGQLNLLILTLLPQCSNNNLTPVS